MKCDHPSKESNYDHTLCKLKLGKELTHIIKLNNPFPGEPPHMKKRKYPAVLRFNKY